MKENHLAFKPQVDLRQELKREFERRRRVNARYSLRSFARTLQLSHSAVSELLAGKRRFSKRCINRIAVRLHWTPAQTQLAVESLEKDPLSFTDLDSEKIAQLDSWYYNAILELFLVEGFKPDPGWIAQALNLSKVEVTEAIERLLDAGQIKRGRNGQLKVSTRQTTTLGNVQSKDTLVKIQQQNLKKGIEALSCFSVESQSSMGLTIPMDVQDLPEARKILYRCLKDLSRLLNRKGVRRRQVYRLQVGLFPLTHL